jgi:N-methylhydantoinase A
VNEVCIGVDVGGTFTDVVMVDERDVWRAKVPTTPDDVTAGVMDGCRAAAARAGTELEALLPSVIRFGLGTTAITNTIAARTGARVGLLTTKGFEETLYLARAHVVSEGGWLRPPPVLVAPGAVIGVDERIDRVGAVITPMDDDEVLSAAGQLVERHSIDALAISFLWSFANPVHESRAADLVREHFPKLSVTSGAALLPVLREYERTTLAVLNAYTAGALSGVEELAAHLASLGLRVPVLLVHSAGGAISIDQARERPCWLAESGPAAGVTASAIIGADSGEQDVITCDMGGTTFDMADVTGGVVPRVRRGRLMGIWTALTRVDVESIGAGGGSLAWADARGLLRVGPGSAGAVPGPACYGRGGTEPTLTDALLVLGYIDPYRFLGGEMVLDHDGAWGACARLGIALGLEPYETAWGIRELALAGMTKAARGRLAQRGLDPRSYSIVSYGGCGALFTPEIAGALGARRVLVPELASVLSALGAATSDVRRERMRSVLQGMPVDPELVEGLRAELRREVQGDLRADGIPDPRQSVAYEADLCFGGQRWDLSVALDPGPVTEDSLRRLVDDFRVEYETRYGKGSLVLGAPVELVALRAVGSGETVHARLGVGQAAPVEPGTGPAPTDRRRVGVRRGRDEAEEVPVYEGRLLAPGHVIPGPALVDRVDTTVWLPRGSMAQLDAHGTIDIALAATVASSDASAARSVSA